MIIALIVSVCVSDCLSVIFGFCIRLHPFAPSLSPSSQTSLSPSPAPLSFLVQRPPICDFIPSTSSVNPASTRVRPSPGTGNRLKDIMANNSKTTEEEVQSELNQLRMQQKQKKQKQLLQKQRMQKQQQHTQPPPPSPEQAKAAEPSELAESSPPKQPTTPILPTKEQVSKNPIEESEGEVGHRGRRGTERGVAGRNGRGRGRGRAASNAAAPGTESRHVGKHAAGDNGGTEHVESPPTIPTSTQTSSLSGTGPSSSSSKQPPPHPVTEKKTHNTRPRKK